MAATPTANRRHFLFESAGDQDVESGARLYDRRVAARLFDYLIPMKGKIVLATLLMLIGSASQVAGPFLIKSAIDGPILEGDLSGISLVVAIFMANGVIFFLAQYGQTYLMADVGFTVLHNLRVHMFWRVQSLSMRFFDKTQAGRVIARLQSDVNAMQELITNGIINTVGDLLTVVGIVVVMFTMNPTLSLLTYAVLPLLFLFSYLWRVRARLVFQETRRILSLAISNLAENVNGVRIVQAFTHEDVSFDAFRTINEEHRESHKQASRLAAMFMPAVEMLNAAALALIVWFGGVQVLELEMTSGVLVAFILYVTRFFEPIRQISLQYTVFQSAVVAGERIFEVIDLEPDVANKPDATPMPPIEGGVTLDRVHFSYDGETPVLKDVSLQVEPGMTVALVGHTGAGKSTIINLLTRFYDVTDGSIRIDDTDIRDVTMESLRRQIAIVLQEPFLYSGSISDNIRFGKLDAKDEEIVAVAKAVGAHDFIMKSQHKYFTNVRERGQGVSMGQRQLISFARALIADPRIIVLDEATSNIDTATEQLIQRAINSLLKDRTAFVIAHRLSTIKEADLVVVMKEGRIAEMGVHDELLARRGEYFNLYTMIFRYQRDA